MMSFSRLLLTIFAWLAAARAARMYLDPSSGSFILQVLIAGLLGGLLTLKLFWARIKSFVTRTELPAEKQTIDSPDQPQ